MELHITHLPQVFQILLENTFYVKKSKYSFGVDSIKYLGHIVLKGFMGKELNKIAAIED